MELKFGILLKPCLNQTNPRTIFDQRKLETCLHEQQSKINVECFIICIVH